MGRLVDPAPPGYVLPKWQKVVMIVIVVVMSIILAISIYGFWAGW